MSFNSLSELRNSRGNGPAKLAFAAWSSLNEPAQLCGPAEPGRFALDGL